MELKLSSFLQWRINVFIYGILGWKITQLYLNLLGRLYFFVHANEKKLVKRGIESVFSGRKKTCEVKAIRRDVFRGIISHYYEKLFNAYSSPEELGEYLRKHVVNGNMTAIREGLARGKGVLLITGHFGGVEFIPGFLASKGLPVSIVARFSSEHLREISREKAEKFCTTIIDGDRSPNIMREILGQLRSNRIVITQCDEIDEWRPSRCDHAFFLRKRIPLDKTIPVLMKRGRATIVFGVIHRVDREQYEFITDSWEDMARLPGAYGDISPGAVVLNRLERYIHRYPEEWYQWKKFAAVESLPLDRVRGAVPSPGLFLEPSYREAS